MSSQQDIAERIAAARREADGLKEKIRAQREQAADTSCTSSLELLQPATTAALTTPMRVFVRCQKQYAPWLLYVPGVLIPVQV